MNTSCPLPPHSFAHTLPCELQLHKPISSILCSQAQKILPWPPKPGEYPLRSTLLLLASCSLHLSVSVINTSPKSTGTRFRSDYLTQYNSNNKYLLSTYYLPSSTEPETGQRPCPPRAYSQAGKQAVKKCTYTYHDACWWHRLGRKVKRSRGAEIYLEQILGKISRAGPSEGDI